MQLRIASSTDHAEWDAVVSAVDGATIFHRWSWLDLFESATGTTIERLFVVDDGVPIGVLPIARGTRRALATIHVPFPYLGPIVPADRLAATLIALRRRQTRSGLVVARFDLTPTLAADADDALREAACTWRDDNTVIVDLRHRSVETLHASFSAMRRKSMRRSARSGATVARSTPGEIRELLPAVLEEAYQVRGIPSPYGEGIGTAIEAFAVGRDDVYLGTAYVDGEPAGVLVGFIDGTTAYAWAGACFRRFRDADPNVLLYADLLEWAIERGCDESDLCGTVDPGVERFKLAFGGELRPYRAIESVIVPARVRHLAQRARGRGRQDAPLTADA